MLRVTDGHTRPLASALIPQIQRMVWFACFHQTPPACDADDDLR